MPQTLKIEIHKDGELLEVRSFEQPIIKIGRLPTAHLQIDDGRVSRIHAVMEMSQDGNLSITDMGSAQGTHVNAERITKIALQEGDEVMVGSTKLVVRLLEDSLPAATPAASGLAAVPMAGDSLSSEGDVLEPADVQLDGSEVPKIQDEPGTFSEAEAGKEIQGAESSPDAGEGHGAQVPAGGMQLPPDVERYDIRGFIEGKVDPSPVPDAHRRAVELRFMWGEVLLDVTQIRKEKAWLIGETKKCNFLLSAEDLTVKELPLITNEGDYYLNILPNMQGVVSVGQRVCTVEDAIRDKLAFPNAKIEGAYSLLLPPDARAAIELGAVTCLIRSVTPTRPFVVPFAGQINYNLLNTFLVSMFLHFAMIIMAINYPYDTQLVRDEIFTTPNRFAKLILTPPEPPPRNPFLDRLKKKDDASAAEKHKGEESQAGLKELLQKDARSAPRAVDPTDKELVSQVFDRLKGGDKGLATVFDQSGLGGDLEGALGGLIGSVVGDSGGAGGLGLKGIGGTGGGGLSGTTIGVGGIGTRGRASGFGEYGAGVHGLGDRREAAINISEGDPVIRGALDRELIRRVIHANRAAIRYCYERELQRTPGIHGRISVRFTIAPNGTVSSASVGQNTMGNRNVADCLIARLQTWRFPEPKGGGVVVVTYPFVFQQAG